MHQIAQLTSGYSGSDLAALARDAAYGPIRCRLPLLLQHIFLLQHILLLQHGNIYCFSSFRELKIDEVKSLDPVNLRKINMSDFLEAMKRIKK